MIATSAQPILTPSTDSSYTSSGYKSLVYWLGRVVEKMAAGSGRKDLEAVWVVASDFLYDEFIVPRPRSLSEQKQTWDELKALQQRHVDSVSIDHRVHRKLHPILSCTERCPTSHDFIFFRGCEKADWNIPAGDQGTLYIGFKPEHWHTVVCILIECCDLEQFKGVVAAAKISDRNFLCPAIIYLYNSECPAELVAFIEEKIKGLEEACSLPGSSSLHSWLHYTEQRLDASGCQPESRADILTQAYDYHHNQHLSVEESMLKASEGLGYQPEQPEFLQKTTPAFHRLLKVVLQKDDEWQPSQQQIRELRGVIRGALADYGFLHPFSLNEHKSGPWEFPVNKEHRFYKPSEEQKKLCISFQLKPDSIEAGLDGLMEQIKSIKALETARFVIRDPEDALFQKEPFILECYLDESQAADISRQLADALPEALLVEESLFYEKEYKKGVISFTRAAEDKVLPSVYENFHNQVITPVRKALSETPPVSIETLLQNQLFLKGRNRHDPLTRRVYIIRPASRF